MVCELKKVKSEGNIIVYKFYSDEAPSDYGFIEVNIKNKKIVSIIRTKQDIGACNYEASRRICGMLRENKFPQYDYEC